MKTQRIIAAENIRVDSADVEMGDVLGTLQSTHNLHTLSMMIRQGQAYVEGDEPENKNEVVDLTLMTTAQLRIFAAKEKIDLGDANRKTEIIKAIQAAR